MNREFSKKDYDNYMRVMIQNIQETESRLRRLDIDKKISQLSYEDWVKFQNGELELLNKTKMSKKIYIASRGTGKVDKDGKITDYTLLSYDLVTPPKRTFFRRIFDFFKKLWNFIKPKQR